jgi:arylsulfatase A-like enzyme
MDVHSYKLEQVRYANQVSVVDDAIGQLIAMLRDSNLMAGTVVIFTSDHGERLGEAHFVAGTPGHSGSPSFEYLIEVPLIVSPAVFTDTDAVLRSDDLHRMILGLAGVAGRPEPDLEPGELFLSERHHQTYRLGRWKSFRQRRGDQHALVDLAADPLETRDVAEQHPGVVSEHRARMDELTVNLAGQAVPGRRLSERDRARLRALGYADSE